MVWQVLVYMFFFFLQKLRGFLIECYNIELGPNICSYIDHNNQVETKMYKFKKEEFIFDS